MKANWAHIRECATATRLALECGCRGMLQSLACYPNKVHWAYDPAGQIGGQQCPTTNAYTQKALNTVHNLPQIWIAEPDTLP